MKAKFSVYTICILLIIVTAYRCEREKQDQACHSSAAMQPVRNFRYKSGRVCADFIIPISTVIDSTSLSRPSQSSSNMSRQDRIPEWLWEIIANESAATASPPLESSLVADRQAVAGPSTSGDESPRSNASLDSLPHVAQEDLLDDEELAKILFECENKLETNTAGKYITLMKQNFKYVS